MSFVKGQQTIIRYLMCLWEDLRDKTVTAIK